MSELYFDDMESHPYVVCDVFTDRALAGNPLAVFPVARGMNTESMQRLARELNLSETTFVLPPERDGHAKVRIFTPTTELPFAGHPTLGTAFVLAEQTQDEVVRLELGVGLVPVKIERKAGRPCFGWMRQPVPSISPHPKPNRVLQALGVERTELPVEVYDNGPTHVLVHLQSRAAVESLQPDLQALSRCTSGGVAVFHAAGDSCKVRYFAPAAGVNEDPGTGSAAGPVALCLLRAGQLQLGQCLNIDQGRELKRPSQICVRITRDDDYVIEVGGSAIIVARGAFEFSD